MNSGAVLGFFVVLLLVAAAIAIPVVIWWKQKPHSPSPSSPSPSPSSSSPASSSPAPAPAPAPSLGCCCVNGSQAPAATSAGCNGPWQTASCSSDSPLTCPTMWFGSDSQWHGQFNYIQYPDTGSTNLYDNTNPCLGNDVASGGATEWNTSAYTTPCASPTAAQYPVPGDQIYLGGYLNNTNTSLPPYFSVIEALPYTATSNSPAGVSIYFT